MRSVSMSGPGLLGVTVAVIWGCTTGQAWAQLRKLPYMLDKLGHASSQFGDPAFSKGFGIEGGMLGGMLQTAITYDDWDNTTMPPGSQTRAWTLAKADTFDLKIKAAKARGLTIFPEIDVFVLPKTLFNKYQSQIVTDGKIDIEKPKTQEILRAQMDGIFARFPDLDGVFIRTGENYTFNSPNHMGTTPMVNGAASHIGLLRVLRESVCIKWKKKLIYRTWDFGTFHTQPSFYLNVTNAIEPHENLVFSIKHIAGDFHRRIVFNPTLNIGKHRQIVEVQCQREYEGKAAYPNYIAKGVIDGFEEYSVIMPSGAMKSLRGFANAPGSLLAGVWTWSRGGGWFGPYVTAKNEFWTYVNTFVLIQWALNPDRSEEDIFNEFALQWMGLDPARLPYFRNLCLLSDGAVLRGRSSLKHGVFNVWWTRDHFISGYLDSRVQATINSVRSQGILDEILAEKLQSVNMWREMEYLSRHLRFAKPNRLGLSNDSLLEVIQASCEYGRLNYAIFQRAWEIQLLKGIAVVNSTDRASKAIADYDFLWSLWRNQRAERPLAATPYTENAFSQTVEAGSPGSGVGASIRNYRTARDTTWPSIPRLYRFVPGFSGWVATWARNRDADFASYRLYLDTVPNPTRLAHTVTAAAETTWTFPSLSPARKYYLRLSAVDTRGLESPFSNEWIDSLDQGPSVARYSPRPSRPSHGFGKRTQMVSGGKLLLPSDPEGRVLDLSVYDLSGKSAGAKTRGDRVLDLRKEIGIASGAHVIQLSKEE